jgi:hypothetical protein
LVLHIVYSPQPRRYLEPVKGLVYGLDARRITCSLPTGTKFISSPKR